jgi:protein-S-isoprenylcysteine O-methyltransferase Ste14
MTENSNDHPNIHKNIHPPIVALFYIGGAYLLGWLTPIYAVPNILRTFGGALICVGFLLGASAFFEFRKARTTLNPHGTPSAVATNGAYRFTRNPIYLGFLLIVIGMPLSSGNYWGLIVAPFFIATINRLVIEHEESYLERKFGDVYANYKSRVRRWL